MRLLFALIVIVAAYFGAVHFSGGAFYSFGLPLGGERAQLRQLASSFIEDIQFKDFDKAASYHEPDIATRVDIPYLLQRLFLQKPETLDIMSYELVLCELDSSELRGRVKVNIKVKNLLDGKIRKQDLMLFFYRKDTQSPWYMKLEDSLRTPEADQNKKH